MKPNNLIRRKGGTFYQFMNYSMQSQHTIIFVSSAIQNFTSDELLGFLNTFRAERLKKNLSGIILYANGNALSMIEGEKEVVETEFNLTKSCPNHHDIIKIYDKAIPHRYFENYSLAFKVIGNASLKSIDDFATDENREYWDECLLLTDDPIIKIIKDFIRNNS